MALKPHDTPLHLAVLKQDVEAVKRLLEEGADLVIKGNQVRQNPLDIAVKLGNHEILDLLINHISEDNITKNAYLKFLNDLLDNSYYWEAANLLETCLTIDINYLTPGSNCLWTAVRKGFSRVVEQMLERGINVNFSNDGDGCDGHSKTALHIACACATTHFNVVALLLKNGAAASFDDSWPFNKRDLCLNLMEGAINSSHKNIVEVLLDHGVDVNSRFLNCNQKFSLLHGAARMNDIEIVKLLVSKGADVNVGNGFGAQPISYSGEHEDSSIFYALLGNKNFICNFDTLRSSITRFFNDYPEKVKALLENVKQFGSPKVKVRVDKELLNNKDDYRRLCDLVISNQNENDRHLDVLVEYGTDVNIRNPFGKTLICTILNLRKKLLTNRLLKFGADINIKCNGGLTPVDYLFTEKLDEQSSHFRSIRGSDELNELIELISQHLLKMRLLNRCVDEKDYQRVMLKAKDPYRYEEKYKKEIDKMKVTIINNNVTFYKIVRADLYKLKKYLQDRVIFETLKSRRYEPEFPEFSIIISGCFHKALTRKRLLDELSRYTIFDIINQFRDPCMRSIMDNFSNQDLRDLMYQFIVLKR